MNINKETLLAELRDDINKGWPSLYNAQLSANSLIIRYADKHQNNPTHPHQVAVTFEPDGTLGIVVTANTGIYKREHVIKARQVIDQVHKEIAKKQTHAVMPAGSYHECPSAFRIIWDTIFTDMPCGNYTRFNVLGIVDLDLNKLFKIPGITDISDLSKLLVRLVAPVSGFIAIDNYRLAKEQDIIVDSFTKQYSLPLVG